MRHVHRLVRRGALAVAVIAAGACVAVSTAAATSAAAAKPAPVTAAIGKVVFKANCGSCHTLAGARTHGNIGPNLDKLKPSMKLVVHQVTNGGGGMPSFAGRLSKSKIQSVAKYVAGIAGKVKPVPGGPGGLP